ncbi:4Fe-4S binding protein [Oscillospiraceae bacterium OttesenSCG-928-G22]|nr:4Fe-4S binding protein [Oscillospiraceae bacterium OttesenSCG-928-G22]
MQNGVTLDREKCMGCTTCIKHCPTEAIRVRRGKAHILKERCIDCGQCIRVCPHHAKKAVCDDFSELAKFEYRVALPAPSLYGQFHNLNDINIILAGLLGIGFHDVFEVSQGAEMISDLTRREMADEGVKKRPLISSACPAVVRLICMRFPKLIPNLSRHIAPMEIAAINARKRAVASTGLAPEQIGVFFITPCPAKVTAIHHPLNFDHQVIDGALPMNEVYKKLLSSMRNVPDPPPLLSHSGIIGIGWARAGGESSALLNEHQLAVDGIENVIGILEEIEDGMLTEVDYFELNSCNQGCVGGCLTAENPYTAKGRIRRLMKFLPVSQNKISEADVEDETAIAKKTLEFIPVWQLDGDRATAMEKFSRIQKLQQELPGLDCGSCGAPSCRALAEDIILGFASEEDCIFRMRERMQYLTGGGDADEYLPPPFRQSKEKTDT